MHELSLAEDIMEIVSRHVERKADVRAVHVTIGPLSGVNAEALEFGFSSLAPRYGLDGAELVVRTVPAQVRCDGCGREYECGDLDVVCPGCGSMEREILTGAEFTLDSIGLKG